MAYIITVAAEEPFSFVAVFQTRDAAVMVASYIAQACGDCDWDAVPVGGVHL